MRTVGVLAAAAAVTSVFVGTAVVSAAPSVVASRVPVTISATSLDVDSLVYTDAVEVQTSSGTVSALRLDLTGATFHQLALTLPCVTVPVGGLTGATTTDGATSASSLVVYATEVIATIDGTKVRISSTDAAYPPPPPGTTLVSHGALVEPTLVSVLATSPLLQTPATRTSASFCTPGGGASGSAAGAASLTPSGPATPTVEPTAPASPDPSTTTQAPEPAGVSSTAEPSIPGPTAPGPADPSGSPPPTP